MVNTVLDDGAVCLPGRDLTNEEPDILERCLNGLNIVEPREGTCFSDLPDFNSEQHDFKLKELTFTFIHLADPFIQSDFHERALQKCIGQ